MTERHTITPIYDQNSRILILGSFPSVRSREVGFYYGHPQNRFWRTLAHVFDAEIPRSTDEKKAFLLSHGIALWDVIAACEIEGSSDASIRGAIPNDIAKILREAPIEAIFTNGATAHKLYRKLVEKQLGRSAILLPSTSPANAARTQENLDAAWSVIAKSGSR
ncbi:MAG: DNA-deoxyinosine glycosylase [Clostridia bacterium]|nr:DNA-deoxyinosine glycosylase [Clostridia bacterium]